MQLRELRTALVGRAATSLAVARRRRAGVGRGSSLTSSSPCPSEGRWETGERALDAYIEAEGGSFHPAVPWQGA